MKYPTPIFSIRAKRKLWSLLNKDFYSLRSFCHIFLLALLLQGCAASGLVKNVPLEQPDQAPSISRTSQAFGQIMSEAEDGIMLAFSGGGTRAAAMAYGVLQELRDTQVGSEQNQRPLLEDVGLISSVSGGSFTAAYYGLYGDRLFSDFETVFLRKNVESALVRNLLNPLHWFGTMDRTEWAIKYYDREVFNNARFADFNRPDAPLILINTTDLSHGVRFSFTQGYFNLLCSDLASFEVSRAVAASSAVPVLFDPVVVENFNDCGQTPPRWLRRASQRADENPELQLTVMGLNSYFDRDEHRYAHFVDGGITDNLGLRAIFDMAQLSGSAKAHLAALKLEPAPRLVVISVDASTRPEYRIGQHKHSPDLFSTINAMTDIQLHRYNTATITEMRRSLTSWAKEISTDETEVDVYFIRLNFDQLDDLATIAKINQVPTSFNLSDDQVDMVVKAGRQLLRENAEFQRLLNTIKLENEGGKGVH